MILTVLHIAQWSLVGVCLPLFGLLLYALAREGIARAISNNAAALRKQGYDAGFRDGLAAGSLTEEDHDQNA